MKRRDFIKTTSLTTTAAMVPIAAHAALEEQKRNPFILNADPLKIGIMTYTIAKDWSIDTIIRNLTETGYQSVELRTTHAHGVEVTLSPSQRAEVKKRFQDSSLEAISLASGFAYHYPDPAQLKMNIEGTKEYTLLARDVGAIGIRVFPNDLPSGVSEEKTIEQIAKSLDEVCEFGYNNGVEVRVCVHGNKTNRAVVIKKIIDMAKSSHVYVNWNCNDTDIEGEGFEYNFNLIKERIKGVHMGELWRTDYPYRLLFKLLAGIEYKGHYCNAEIDGSDDSIRLLRYYKALFLAYQDAI